VTSQIDSFGDENKTCTSLPVFCFHFLLELKIGWFEILSSIFYGLQAFGAVIVGPLVALYVGFALLDVAIFAVIADSPRDRLAYWQDSVWSGCWKYLDWRYSR
jgi:hypothetical protein